MSDLDDARGDLTEVEKDAVRDSYALLRAALDGDESGARVIAKNARPVETLASLAVLAVSIAGCTGFDLDGFIDWGMRTINQIDDVA